MSANISQRKLHGAVMGATVAGFAGWRLVVACLPRASAVAVQHRPQLKTRDLSANVVYGPRLQCAPARPSELTSGGYVMTTRIHFVCAAGGMLIASLALSQPTLAQQQQGITSGPAVGTAVVPSTTAQKQNSAATAASGQPATAATLQGAAGVGAPGVAAKSGSEGGSSPGPGTGKRP